jgi:hypothetical protein
MLMLDTGTHKKKKKILFEEPRAHPYNASVLRRQRSGGLWLEASLGK